ncbi:MAG: nucleotidyltransferase, partial [Lachnospiraceae bacterium]|nr:nucleotidyltransferase [Lachnospiraceae bacterium]
MKICGLIAEYNPFHNGHLHHIEQARALTGCDYLVVVMSGYYVQRGTPAVIDKYARTRMALNGGADLVIELPTLFSTASAETFATAAVSLLYQLGCVDAICFGTEAGDLTALQKIAQVLNHEPESFQEDLRDGLKMGLNFAKARSVALENYFGGEIDRLDELIETPNNILGIEYLRAIDRLNAGITPYTVKRWATDYHSVRVYEDTASATALRYMLYEEDAIDRITPYVPAFITREFALKLGISTPVRADDFSMILQDRLLMHRDHLTDFLDFSSDLADRVNNILPDAYTFKEWASALKSKAYTRTRINRALLHVILNIREEDLEAYRDEDYCMYARILGFREAASPLLTKINRSTALPMIGKMSGAK